MAAKPAIRAILARVIPAAFVLGAGMELFMVYVRIGDETFYDVAKRLECERREEKLRSRRELEERVRRRKKKTE